MFRIREKNGRITACESIAVLRVALREGMHYREHTMSAAQLILNDGQGR
jgi:hypothetical protein